MAYSRRSWIGKVVAAGSIAWAIPLRLFANTRAAFKANDADSAPSPEAFEAATEIAQLGLSLVEAAAGQASTYAEVMENTALRQTQQMFQQALASATSLEDAKTKASEAAEAGLELIQGGTES